MTSEVATSYDAPGHGLRRILSGSRKSRRWHNLALQVDLTERVVLDIAIGTESRPLLSCSAFHVAYTGAVGSHLTAMNRRDVAPL
jgi:hypothetical protein